MTGGLERDRMVALALYSCAHKAQPNFDDVSVQDSEYLTYDPHQGIVRKTLLLVGWKLQ
jgi:hypothetical protein